MMKQALVLAIAMAATGPAASAPRDAPLRRADVAKAASAMRARLVDQRRDFHMHPELSNREERTSRVVAERLRALGLKVRTGVGKYGVVGVLEGGKPGPVVAVRADMDALPIQETLDVPYKSQVDGVKHACGHDAHTTIELGVAEILAGMRDRIAGKVVFVFQPSEEGPPPGEEGGARFMIKEGALEDPKPSAIFGLHTMPALEVGTIGVNSGSAMASSDKFVATIHGKKVHGAYPHEGVDAVVVASECVAALQTIRSRRVNTMEPLVVTVGSIHGGNRYNIIADSVTLEGTVRTLDEGTRRDVQRLMRETLAGVTSAYGASFDLEFVDLCAVTYNDPSLVDETLPSMRAVLGDAKVVVPRPQMAGEDFSAYQQIVPGFFYFLGVGNRAKGVTAQWHTPEFDIDEESLVVGVDLMSNVVLDYLDRHASR